MIDVVVNLLVALISLLPASPFLIYLKYADDISGLAYLNYFVPFDLFSVILESWIVAIGIYYAYRVAKKNIKST